HEGHALSIRHRKRIDLRRDNDPPDRCLILLTFGWARTVGGMAQTVYRGAERVRSRFILTMAANNLARLPRPLAA
ncbi:MAG: IS5/IS1182 family transposase, partial [Rhodobacteraceae bacterium]|nr:IS5/IS1182 family transposase [Paracoccaceae bacterium]